MCDSKAGQDVFMLIKLFADQIRIINAIHVYAWLQGYSLTLPTYNM